MSSVLNFNLREQNILKVILIVFTIFFSSLSIEAYAQNTTADTGGEITKTLCNAVNMLTGTVGRAIAILIVISLAISLFLGKVSWGVAIAVGVGMGILFGARDVVDTLSGGTSCK